MDLKRKMKEKVLDEIIQLMDQEEGEELKKKSPKFMKVETNDPEMAEELVEEVIPKKMEEMDSKEEDSEFIQEDKLLDEEDEDEKRLRELYSKLK